MPLFGAHMSIAGGLHKALEAAQTYDCETVQLFTASPHSWAVTAAPATKPATDSERLSTRNSAQWFTKPLTTDIVATFRRTLKQTHVRVLVAHDSYLINLASPDNTLHRRSLEELVAELERSERLGLDYVVIHPGAHAGSGEAAGLLRIAAGLDEVHRRCPKYRVQILLETTAGQGTTLGHRFEHLAEIIARTGDPERLGVCLDTCHVFAAGYPLSPRKEYLATMREFDRVIGLDRLRVFHLNDSLKPIGSRVDRHAHIGRGCLGLEPFQHLVNDRRFRKHPMILETPKESDEHDMDALNLRTLRDLVKK